MDIFIMVFCVVCVVFMTLAMMYATIGIQGILFVLGFFGIAALVAAALMLVAKKIWS